MPVCLASALSPTKTTSDTSTLRSMAPPSLHMKVSPSIPGAPNRASGLWFSAGIFKLELFLPDDYPMTPPKIRFLTKIYHPNIDKLGRICLDVLKSTLQLCSSCHQPQLTRTGNWSPALQIRTILLSIQALLGAPNPDDPLANDVAQRWKEDEPAAIQTAREWTRQYAKA